MISQPAAGTPAPSGVDEVVGDRHGRAGAVLATLDHVVVNVAFPSIGRSLHGDISSQLWSAVVRHRGRAHLAARDHELDRPVEESPWRVFPANDCRRDQIGLEPP